jgi:hypothetical protein
MKITKQQLKQIIKEEISTLTEGGQWPGSGDSLRALAPLADAIANDLGVDLYEDNIAERLAEIVLKEFYEGSDGDQTDQESGYGSHDWYGDESPYDAGY